MSALYTKLIELDQATAAVLRLAPDVRGWAATNVPTNATPFEMAAFAVYSRLTQERVAEITRLAENGNA
jgi:hypothetical protein